MNDQPSASPLPAKPIVLVGLMGAGKSSIGKRLAARLGLPFVDADDEIEKAANLTISEIFERHGEAAFRDGERRVIGRLLAERPGVLATGGGAFMDAQTRALILERAISIWLRAEIEVLLKRVARRSNRPLLQNKDPRQVLEGLMAERYPVYALADIVIDTGDGPHDIVVDQVLTTLRERQAAP